MLRRHGYATQAATLLAYMPPAITTCRHMIFTVIERCHETYITPLYATMADIYATMPCHYLTADYYYAILLTLTPRYYHDRYAAYCFITYYADTSHAASYMLPICHCQRYYVMPIRRYC